MIKHNIKTITSVWYADIEDALSVEDKEKFREGWRNLELPNDSTYEYMPGDFVCLRSNDDEDSWGYLVDKYLQQLIDAGELPKENEIYLEIWW